MVYLILGRFILEPWRFRTWVIPDLAECEVSSTIHSPSFVIMGTIITRIILQLKPYVSKEANKHLRRAHTFRDYFREQNLPENMDTQLAERCQATAKQAYKKIVSKK